MFKGRREGDFIEVPPRPSDEDKLRTFNGDRGYLLLVVINDFYNDYSECSKYKISSLIRYALPRFKEAPETIKEPKEGWRTTFNHYLDGLVYEKFIVKWKKEISPGKFDPSFYYSFEDGITIQNFEQRIKEAGFAVMNRGDKKQGFGLEKKKSVSGWLDKDFYKRKI